MRKVGPYTLGARLGSGTLGEVFLGAGDGGELVAVKRFDRDLSSDLAFVRDLTTELAAARAIDRIGVARVVDAGRQGEQPWAAYVPVPGQTLASFTKRARLEGVALEPAIWAWVGARLGRAMLELHRAEREDARHGFVLGRFSPRDVMIGYDGRVVILGLGEARARARTPVASRRLPYCAPEVLAGREPTPLSDLFSLAAVLYELFSGAPAFRRSDDESTRGAVRRGDVAPLRPGKIGVQPEIGDLIMQAMLPRSEARPERLDEVIGLLETEAVDDGRGEAELAELASNLFRDQRESWLRMAAALVPERTRATVDINQQEPVPESGTGSGVDDTGDANGPPDSNGSRRIPTDDLLFGQGTAESRTGDADLESNRPGALGPAGEAGPRIARIARYRLARRIEVDGPRSRYHATDPNLGREVEVEILDAELADGRLGPADWIRTFKLEGRHIAQLQIEGLPRLLDAGKGGDLYFLVYERRGGRSLPRHLAEGRALNPARVVGDVARILDHVHRAGFVHGDLRPATLRVRSDGAGEIGRVRRLTPIDRAPHPLSRYDRDRAPPELRESGVYTPASDQWALGAVLFELLTGVSPLKASPEPLVPPHVADPDVPEQLSTLCLRMLESAPDRRWPSLAEVADELAEHTSTVVRAAPALPDDDNLEVALAFAHLCRRVAGVSTLSASDDSPWHPDPAVWAADIARRCGLDGRAVRAVMIAAAARDLARRTHLPVLGPELDMVVPELARELLVAERRDEDESAALARQVIDLVERFADVMTGPHTSVAAAVRLLGEEYPAPLVDALVQHLDVRLPGGAGGGDGPRVLLAGEAARHADALEREGLTGVPVPDGHAAWEALRTATFDGAVLPVRLAGRDGLSLLRLCRSRDELAELPVWLVGDAINASDRRFAEERGAVVVDAEARPLHAWVVETLVRGA